MKILLYGINFAPEPTGIGKYTGEMATWLAEQGHEVRVVTAPPHYPNWQVWPGFKAWSYTREAWQGAGVNRCPVWVPAWPRGTKRVLHLLSFALSSLPVVLWQALTWRPDVVWVCAPAFACTPGALLAAKLGAAKAWLHIQDYEIDLAFSTGQLRGGVAKRLVSWLERWILRRFDVVSSISDRMLQKARDKGVRPERLVMFPNWVDVDAIQPLHGRSPYRDELGIGEQTVVALFSGTLGGKQGLHMLPEAAKVLATTNPDVLILICGDGVMEGPLRVAAQGLHNVKMLPLQPKERLNDLLGAADIHLLPQETGVADLVMPSKLTAMLASGRPVVTTAAAGSEIATALEGCGRVASNATADCLADEIDLLAKNPALRRQYGASARRYAVAKLGIGSVLGAFANIAHKLKDRASAKNRSKRSGLAELDEV